MIVFGELASSSGAGSSTSDPDETNGSASTRVGGVACVDPPVTSNIVGVRAAAKTYRVRITGSNFREGVRVFIGADPTPWSRVKLEGSDRVASQRPGQAVGPEGRVCRGKDREHGRRYGESSFTQSHRTVPSLRVPV
jgi:hypothetical protein